MAFPLTAAPALVNWQMQFNGLTIGAQTPYAVYQPIGGLDLPAARTGDVSRPREHGAFMGLDLMSGRTVTITGDYITDGTSVEHSQASLASAFRTAAITEVPFWFQLPNYPTLCAMVRVRKRNMPIDLAFSTGGMGQYDLMMYSSDPRLYGGPQVGSCGVGQPLGGGTFPAHFPYTFTHGSVAGVVNAFNYGNTEMRPLLTIHGPITNPTIYNATTGWTLTITNPFQTGYTVLAGDTLVIDTDLHTILYYSGGTGAGASRRSWLVPGSIWPSTPLGIDGITPGANTIQFTSTDSGSVAGSLIVQWANAYLL